MMHILVDFLPTFLGFLGFFIYRRYSATGSSEKQAPRTKSASDSTASPKKEQNSEHVSEPDNEFSPTQVSSEVEESEPEPSPEPDLSDDSPIKKPVAEPAGQMQRRRWASIVVIAAYVAATIGVFVWFSMEDPVAESIQSSSDIAEEAVDTEAQERELAAQRAKYDLPFWPEMEGDINGTGLVDERIMILPLKRQFMTLRSEEGQVIYYKSAYWGTLEVGTPRQAFKVVFDTGSGHLILPSTYCHSPTCKAHARFRRGKSSTAKDIDHDGSVVGAGLPRDQITVSFGTGEVTGVFIEDILCVDETSLPPKESETEAASAPEGMSQDAAAPKEALDPGCFKLRIILATEMSEDPFKDFHFDGVLGLGLAPLSQADEFNFPHVVAQLADHIGAPSPQTFGVFLAMHEGETSELSIGGRAWSRQAGPMAWSPVIMPEHGHWMISIKNIYVDGELVEFCRDGTCRAVADTGTSLLAVPSGSFPEIYELLRHNAPLEGYCNSGGPALQFELEGNVTVSMLPEDYSSLEPITKTTNSSRDWFKRFFYAKGWPLVQKPRENFRRDMYCKPLLMSMDLPAPIGPKLFILGEPLLRRYYTVYDSKEKKIGWAQARHSEAPPPAAQQEETDDWWDAEDDA